MSDTHDVEEARFRALTLEEADELERICNHLRARAMHADTPRDLFPMFQQLDEIRRKITGEED